MCCKKKKKDTSVDEFKLESQKFLFTINLIQKSEWMNVKTFKMKTIERSQDNVFLMEFLFAGTDGLRGLDTIR